MVCGLVPAYCGDPYVYANQCPDLYGKQQSIKTGNAWMKAHPQLKNEKTRIFLQKHYLFNSGQAG
jgi:hypothetical protein